MSPTRDPYPYPRYENENTYRVKEVQNCASQNVTYRKPTHLAQQEDPWYRLNATPTLSSARREVYYHDPEAPSDSLDFNLKTLYNHHEGLLKDRNETLFQRETYTENHGRILKNRKKEPLPLEDEKTRIREWVCPQRISIHSINGAIMSHHSATTNRGYSRKKDGGYYSI